MSDDDDGGFALPRNRLKEALTSDRLTVCLRTTMTATNDVPFFAHAAGYDAVYVDLEHAPTTLREAAQVCSTATALGLTSLVRLRHVDDDAAVTLLDAGCQGVIAPHVQSPDEAARLVDRCLFPPLGSRSPSGPVLLPGLLSPAAPGGAAALNRATLLCVMLETGEAVERAMEIAAVEGVDLVLVGTQDLSSSLGIPGQVDAPAVRAMYEQVAAASAATGTPFGVAGVSDLTTIERYVALGARFVTAGSDVELLRRAVATRLHDLRGVPVRP